MERGSVYNKYKGPERYSLNKRLLPAAEERGGEKVKENIVFSIVLGEGAPSRSGEKEALEVTFDNGITRINGCEVPFIEGGALVVEYNKQEMLTEEQQKLLGIDKILAQRDKKY